uniref:SH3 domain containing GRB2 like, endophilin B2 n=1 Tax=Molossus molossus TaxID=27622 RepID=A0A7J8EFX8_MOLMO|nr:SH3 domain containing GRB2 like, endophilin B2 [Molossus molossus]
MDFNMKKLASDAGIFFTRAVQFTEEKFGQAEKTELDAHFENLLARADSTKNWTEKILRQTEVLLQPNPSARVEEFLYEKLDRKVPSRVTNGELLAQYMAEAASELGPTTPYGKTLIKVAEAEKRLGAAERDFIHTASINFLTPLLLTWFWSPHPACAPSTPVLLTPLRTEGLAASSALNTSACRGSAQRA